MPTTVISVKMKRSEEISKKYINDPMNVVEDALKGLTEYNPNTCPRVVVRRDEVRKEQKMGTNKSEAEGKVALIAGGGSGHEPYAAGYVGKGMLTAAVAGNVFASPPSKHIEEALEETKSNAGSILFVINYTGDRLNFGLAAERFKSKGNDVQVVTVADDIAIDTCKTKTGSRGLAGAILVLKIAGALAEKEASIAEIEQVCKEVCKNLKTFGCSMNPCSLPGKGPMFHLPPTQYEVGLGIHGEAGKERIKIETAEAIVDRLLKELIVTPKNLASYVILLNNLGSVSQIEMDILKSEILKWCANNNVNLVRLFCGTYMTSLNAHGMSLTVLEVTDSRYLDLLDAEADCPGWKQGLTICPKFTIKTNTLIDKELVEEAMGKSEPENQKLKKVILTVCDEMRKREKELNDLDRAAGDGDCGETFRTAANAIQNKIEKKELCLFDYQKCLEQIAIVFEESVGGTSGAIYALLLSVFAQNLSVVDDETISKALKNATEAVEKYGGATAGDRTVIDTLRSALKELNKDNTIDWEKVVKAAETGAEETAKMIAMAGRASYTSEKMQTRPDAGAMAMAYWLRALWDQVKTT